MKHLLQLFIISLFLISCSNVTDNTYSEDTFKEDLPKLKETLNAEDFEMLEGYIMLSAMGGQDMSAKTYKELIEDGKELKLKFEQQAEEERLLAEKAKQEQLQRAIKLNKSLTVSLFEKGFVKHDYQEYITYEFVIENKTDKDIRAFTGEFVMNDLFDEKIKTIGFTFDDGVKANSVINYSASSDYNQFTDSDVKLKSKKMNQLKVSWVPSKILFSDDTILE
jgi:hypothetical protein